MGTEPINPATTGILMVLGAYAIFTVADSSAKWVLLSGMSAVQLAFCRYCVHSLITATESGIRGIQRREISENLKLLVLRGAVLTLTTVLNFLALRYLALSIYSALMLSVPIFVSVLAWPMLGERVGPWRWAAILGGFIGVLIIVRPFDDQFHWAGVFTLSAAISMAVYSILTRKLAHRVRPHVMQFFTSTFGMLALLPIALWWWEPVDTSILPVIVLVGVSTWAGHEVLTRAHKHAEASVLMPYSYSWIVYMSLAGYLVYAEVPDGYTVIGAVVVIVAGLVIWHRERTRKARSLSQPLSVDSAAGPST